MGLKRRERGLVGIVLILFLASMISVLPGYFADYIIYFVLLILFASVGLLKTLSRKAKR